MSSDETLDLLMSLALAYTSMQPEPRCRTVLARGAASLLGSCPLTRRYALVAYTLALLDRMLPLSRPAQLPKVSMWPSSGTCIACPAFASSLAFITANAADTVMPRSACNHTRAQPPQLVRIVWLFCTGRRIRGADGEVQACSGGSGGEG